MDHRSRLACVTAVVALLAGAETARANQAEPSSSKPVSGVGAVTLGARDDVESLRATADRLASRIESAASRGLGDPIEASGEPPATSDAAPLPAPVPEAEVADEPSGEAGTIGTARTPITDRFGGGVGGMLSPRGDQGGGWWTSPEVRVVGLLVALGVVAFVAKRMSRRGVIPGAGRPSGVLSVLARYPFGRGATLVLVECGPRILLLHQHGGKGGEITALTEFVDANDVADLRTRLGADSRTGRDDFERSLARNLGRYDRTGRPEGFGGRDGLALDDAMETVDLTRRRPRRGARG